MGAGVSKEEESQQNGNIIIRTDKTTHVSGDLVSGKIYLHAFSSHPPCQLELEFYGIELSSLVISSKNHQLDLRHHKFNDISWHLHQWESGLSTGHIEIPFSFTLPLDLPPSFYQEGIDFLAHISYILKAWLKPIDKTNEFKPLSRYEKIVVRRTVKRTPNSYSEEKQLPLTLCCCIPRGFVTIMAHMEKDIYSEQEVAKVFFEVDNTQGNLDISSVQFRLLQMLKMNNDFTTYIPICAVAITKIRAKTKSGPQVLQLNIPRFRGDTHNLETRSSLWPQGKTNNSNGILGLTTQGKFVSSEFYLEVVCFVDDFETSKISRYIDITYPDPQPQALNLPENWNPQVLPIIPLQLNSSIKKPKKQKEEPGNGKMIETKMIRDDVANSQV